MLHLLAILVSILPAYAGAVLVGTAPLPADGTTASDVRVLVEACPKNTRARIKVESGKVANVTTSPECIVSFTWTPPATPAPKSLPVTVQVQSEEWQVQVPVAPPFAGDVGLSFDPPVIAAGATATVKIKPSGTSPVAQNSRRMVLTASVGTVDPAVPLGDGTWSARYTAPKTLTAPVMVAITAADAASPSIQGWAGLPVTMRKSVTFDAQTGSVNVLNVGGKQYGPFKADAKGKVTYELELDPRYPVGRLQSVNADTSRTEKEVPMPSVPQQGQIVFLPMPASIAVDPAAPLPVRVVALAPNGDTVPATGVVMTASAGTLGAPAPDGKVTTAAFTTPPNAQEVTLGATWNGVVATRRLRILAPLPTMTLAADPADFPKGGGSVKVVARLKDAAGVALSGRAPSITADGASISGKVTDHKDGSYSVSVSGSSKLDRARVYGTPPMDVSSLAPARLLVWAGSPTVVGNGLDSTSLTLVAVDAYDLPVPNVEFKLSVPRGDGVLPASVKADARGIAHANFKAGTTAGLGTIHVEAAGLMVELPIFQVGKKQFLTVESGGPAAWSASLEKWRHASPTLTIVRDGVVPASGPPADMQISSTPGYTTPGANIAVQVFIVDDNGLGVAGQKLQIGAAPATVGPITDSRDGNYKFNVALPAGTDGPLKITVAAGLAITALELPTLEQAGGARATATVVAESKPSGFGGGSSGTIGVKKPAGPARSGNGEPARGRFGAGLANTRGPYSLTSDGGGGLANAATEAPGAGFFGLGAHADFGVPVGPGRVAFGLDGRMTANVYSVNGEGFLVLVRDVTVGGRYLHGVAEGLHVGGGVDLQSLSAPYYTYTDEFRTAANLAVADWLGVRVVGELNVDLPSELHLELDVAETFAWAPAGTHVGALLDVPLGEAPVAFRAGVAWDWHYLPTTDLGAAGTIDEHILGLELGVVYVLR